MATENVGGIEYTIDAKVDPLLKANKEAERSIDGFDKAIDQADKSSRKFDTRLGKLSAGIKKANQSMIAGAKYAAALGAAMTAVTATAASAGREIKQMAALSNTSVERFQELAFGASQVGVSAEKLGDIFKDVQDKVGDFLATGGGELADYFENIAPKVGQTAEEFRGLSGPDALIKFKQGLDAANLSAAEQIFYLESLANDVSLLQPLLANNAQGFADAASKARELNLVLSEAEVSALADVNREFNQLLATIGKMTQKIVAENAPQIKQAIQGIVDIVTTGAQWIGDFFGSFASAENISDVDQINKRIEDTKNLISWWENVEPNALFKLLGIDNTDQKTQKIAALNAELDKLIKRKQELEDQPVMQELKIPKIVPAQDGANDYGDYSGGEMAGPGIRDANLNVYLRETLGITQELANQIETLDQKFANIGQTMKGELIGSMYNFADAAGQGLAQAVADGDSLNDTLRNVASTVATQLLGSFITLGIQYGINAALKSAADSQMAASGIAATQSQAAASEAAGAQVAAANAPAAAATATWSFGGAALAGAAALASIYALSTAGGRLNGGPVSAGSLYDVNENGKPELLTVGNKQMLMMGNQSGSVTSNKDLMAAGGSGVSIVVNNNASGAEATATSRQQDGKTIVEVVVADIANRGKIHKAITSNTTANNRT